MTPLDPSEACEEPAWSAPEAQYERIAGGEAIAWIQVRETSAGLFRSVSKAHLERARGPLGACRGGEAKAWILVRGMTAGPLRGVRRGHQERAKGSWVIVWIWERVEPIGTAREEAR